MRYLLLHGGTAPFDTSIQGGLKKASLEPRMRALSQKLAVLGEHSFFGPATEGSTRIRAEPRIDVTTSQLLGEINSYPPGKPDDIFLYVYVGHSIPAENDDENIVLSYHTDGGLHRSRTETFETVLDWIHSRGYRKLICILDCCHAFHGHGALRRFRGKYYTMFSASGGFAKTGVDGGIFIRGVREALEISVDTPVDQRFDVNASGITFESLFRYVSANLPEDTEFLQTPVAEGDLGSVLLQGFRRALPRRLDGNATQVSVYRKLFAILELFGDEGQRSLFTFPLEDLISSAQARPEFEARRLGEAPEPISGRRVQEIIEFMVDLGMLSYHDREAAVIRRTEIGDEAARRSEYTAVLRRQLLERILPAECTIPILREIIKNLLSSGRQSDENVIRLELEERGIRVDNRGNFKEAVRLLPYVGIFQKATQGTLFPGFDILPEDVSGS